MELPEELQVLIAEYLFFLNPLQDFNNYCDAMNMWEHVPFILKKYAAGNAKQWSRYGPQRYCKNCRGLHRNVE